MVRQDLINKLDASAIFYEGDDCAGSNLWAELKAEIAVMAAQSAKVTAALILCKEMFKANDLVLPHTMDLVDRALEGDAAGTRAPQTDSRGEPVAWRVRVKSDDPEEWSLLPAGGGADYLDREGYECQPLYVLAPEGK